MLTRASRATSLELCLHFHDVWQNASISNPGVTGETNNKSQKGDIISHPSSSVTVPAVAPLVRHEEGVLRDPVDGVEGGEDEREGGHAHEVQQLDPPLQPLSLKVRQVKPRVIRGVGGWVIWPFYVTPAPKSGGQDRTVWG